MNAYKFNTTILEGGMIFFPFYTEFQTKEVEVIVVQKELENSTNTISSVDTQTPALSAKKPSDFFGTLSENEGEDFKNYVTNSRLEWNRNNN